MSIFQYPTMSHNGWGHACMVYTNIHIQIQIFIPSQSQQDPTTIPRMNHFFLGLHENPKQLMRSTWPLTPRRRFTRCRRYTTPNWGAIGEWGYLKLDHLLGYRIIVYDTSITMYVYIYIHICIAYIALCHASNTDVYIQNL